MSRRPGDPIRRARRSTGLLAAVAACIALATAALLLSTVGAAGAASPTASVLASGDNFYGELGSATNADKPDPNPAPALVGLPGLSGRIAQMAAGNTHSLIVSSSGQLYAFGNNDDGQLGLATNSGTTDPNPTPTPVALPGQSGQVSQIAAGLSHSLAATTGGQLYAFGDNQNGQLGDPATSGIAGANPTPTLVSVPGPIAQLAAGGDFSMVLNSSDQLFTFGGDQYGQLGYTGAHPANPTPTQVTLPGQSGAITQIAAGWDHGLALTSSGQLYAFGENNYGQLGSTTNVGSSNPNPTPTQVSLPGLSGQIVQIAAEDFASLALTSSGQLYAFGDNSNGQLGSTTNNGTNTPNPTPALLTLPGSSGQITQIAGGSQFGLVVTSSGQLYGFGSNEWGQLGNTASVGTLDPNPTPTLISLPAGTTVEGVAVGPLANHVLALISDLTVSTAGIPSAQVAAAYSAQLDEAGGGDPLTWAASGLPAGLSLNGSTGALSGVPSAAGNFSVVVSVTDSFGRQASATLTLAVAPQPPAVLSGLHVRPRKFSLRGRRIRGRCVKPRAGTGHDPSCRRRVKLRISYRLDHASAVTVTAKRRRAGRETGGHCATPTRRNGKHRRCTRLVAVKGRLVVAGKTGPNHFTLHRMNRRHRLKAGRYQLVATPTSGRPVRVNFRITS